MVDVQLVKREESIVDGYQVHCIVFDYRNRMLSKETEELELATYDRDAPPKQREISIAIAIVCTYISKMDNWRCLRFSGNTYRCW